MNLECHEPERQQTANIPGPSTRTVEPSWALINAGARMDGEIVKKTRSGIVGYTKARKGRKSCKNIFVESLMYRRRFFVERFYGEASEWEGEWRKQVEAGEQQEDLLEYIGGVFSRLDRKHECGTEWISLALSLPTRRSPNRLSCFMVCSPTWLLHDPITSLPPPRVWFPLIK